MVKSLFIFFLTISTVQAFGQDDSLDVKKDKWEDYEHKPKKAAFLSLLPGAGQIYNEIGHRRVRNKKHRSWWKVPLILGGLGTTGYYYWHNFSRSKLIKEEILFRRDNGISSNLHPELSIFASEDSLINGYYDFNAQKTIPGFDLHARRREIFLAATLGIYGLQIIEAFVDGHFVSFDVSDDLSMSISPLMYDRYSPGVNLRLTFN